MSPSAARGLLSFNPEAASTADYARYYWLSGMQAAPAKVPGCRGSWKRPDLHSWQYYTGDLIDNLKFMDWFPPGFKKNVGIITGVGGHWVLDIDLQKYPEAAVWLQTLLDANNSGLDLDTATQRTGGGGLQLVFKAPAGWAPPTFRTDIGVDIRGAGGFAVMPPSLHASGNRYAWLPGKEPWTVGVIVSPTWLTDAVDKLPRGSTRSAGQTERTPTPEHATNSLGLLVDGREDYMTRLVWVKVVDMHRANPALPDDTTGAMKEAFRDYLREVSTRIDGAGAQKDELLEREGRGLTLFTQKWKRAIRQWDTKVKDAAKGQQLIFKGAGAAPESHGDIKNARVFASKWRRQLLYVTTRGRWFIWLDGRWTPCEKGKEQECAKATCDELMASGLMAYKADPDKGKRQVMDALAAHRLPRILAMLKLAISEPGMAVTDKELDADPMLLGVENGVVNLRTGGFLRNEPQMLITRFCNAKFDPNASCPRWMQFLVEVFQADDETIISLQRLLGYTLTGWVTEEILVICFGFGSNGKSIFSNTVHRIVGGYAKTAPASLLASRRDDDSSPRNDLAAMAGARYVSINEYKAGARLDEQVVKQLAGREPIAARFLYQELFEYLPTFTAWLRTNHKPVVVGDDDGIWRRLVVIPFRRKFEESEKDEHLEEKLFAERDGILRWMLEGTRLYLKDGLQLSKTIKAEQAAYRKESDMLGEFLEEKTKPDPSVRAEQSAIFSSWKWWCEENGTRHGSKKSFSQRMAERGYPACQSNGNRYYTGLALLSLFPSQGR